MIKRRILKAQYEKIIQDMKQESEDSAKKKDNTKSAGLTKEGK